MYSIESITVKNLDEYKGIVAGLLVRESIEINSIKNILKVVDKKHLT